MKKAFIVFLSLIIFILTVGCGFTNNNGIKIGISMPMSYVQRWNRDGGNMKEKLLAQGFNVDLQFLPPLLGIVWGPISAFGVSLAEILIRYPTFHTMKFWQLLFLLTFHINFGR